MLKKILTLFIATTFLTSPLVAKEKERKKEEDSKLTVASYLLKEALNLSPKGKDIQLSFQKNKDGYVVVAPDLLSLPFTLSDQTETLQQFILQTIESLSNKTDIKLSAKKVLPYLHLTSSWNSLTNYVQGSLALESGHLAEAILLLNKSIESDYNHTYAYLKMAEALAQKGDPVSQNQARIQFEKARLLNPVHAKLYEKRIETLLKGKK